MWAWLTVNRPYLDANGSHKSVPVTATLPQSPEHANPVYEGCPDCQRMGEPPRVRKGSPRSHPFAGRGRPAKSLAAL